MDVRGRLEFLIMERGWKITITIVSLMFGIIIGFGKDSFWWGIGSTVLIWIIFWLGYWFGVMLEGIDNELKERRK